MNELWHAAARRNACLFLIALSCVACLFGFMSSSTHIAAQGVAVTRGGPVRVVGTLALVVSGDVVPARATIALPDAQMYLQDPRSGTELDRATTQLDGKFYLDAPGPGTYRICWKSIGIGSDCGDRFVVQKEDLFLGVVPVRPQPGLVYGKVLTADGRACWVNDPFFELDVSTRVSLLNHARQVVRTGIRANVSGEYAIAGVKQGDRYIVRADCENAEGKTTASLGSSPVVANVTLPNHAPRIEALSAFENGKAITRAASGATVRVMATTRDPDNDQVEYLWRLLDGYGSIPGANSPQQDWTLAAKPGLYALYLVARDGKGGYAFKRFDLQVGANDVSFSGRVIDETAQTPVAGASVAVNGVNATTNAQGWFSLAVPPVPAPERYVLNIRDPQYALLSSVYDRAAAGNTYELIRAQTTSHDPAQVIDVVDSNSSGPCGSPGGKPGTQYGPGLQLSSRRDRAKTAATTVTTRPCRHRGAHVVVPAGALVDAAQNPAQGPVKFAFATLNPARRALPGDYRAVNRNNAPVEMLSFGALFAQFRDANGKPLNLKPGIRAQIRVPVSNQQRPFAKPTIAVWSYDEARGLWVEEGKAILRNTPEGWMYVGATKHLSTLNMDVAGNDPAQATCVRFTLGASLSGWTNLVLRAYVSYAGTSLKVKETPLDGAQYNAIYRIPYAPPAPPPNTLRLELRGTYNGQQVVLLNNVINTDAPRPKMTGNNLWPPYDYSECGVPITLEADPVNLPYYGDIDATGRPAFLTGPQGQFLPANGDATATAYYNTIDPGNANPTLAAWWGNHGFNGTDGSGGTRAAYLNYNDLGFGRDMNCLTTGGDLACYVTNYGAPDQNPANADDAQNRNPAKRGATVAMEYKASEPPANQVRFFVYAPGDPATAGRLKFADLDGLGPKPVPHLCIVCHGGYFDGGANNTTQARFREFDLPSFKYSGGRSWDFAPSPNTLAANELTAFAGLNQMVRDVAPNTSPIKDLINNWYPGGFGAGTAPVKPAVPSGWNTQVNGYHNVYAKSCRTCHVARDNGNPNTFITFNNSASYAGTSYVVCDSPKVMPNAYITYKNFWNDLQRVIDYRALQQPPPATCQ
jgi:hypothetical protein